MTKKAANPRVPVARFSPDTIAFIRKAGKQRDPDWLEKNRADYERLVRAPIHALAAGLAARLRPLAPDYHFPLRGLGHLKRPAYQFEEYGSAFKRYVSLTIKRPSPSRFEQNPSLFFMINSEDGEGDEVLLAGGLYMPSSRQLKAIREKIAENPAPFEALFRSKAFAARFPGGFSDERTATRAPRGFDPAHSHIHWLKLQGFFVWRSYRRKEFASPDFAAIAAKDGEQLLRLNALLEQAIHSRWPAAGAPLKRSRREAAASAPRAERLGSEKIDLPTPDF